MNKLNKQRNVHFLCCSKNSKRAFCSETSWLWFWLTMSPAQVRRCPIFRVNVPQSHMLWPADPTGDHRWMLPVVPLESHFHCKSRTVNPSLTDPVLASALSPPVLHHSALRPSFPACLSASSGFLPGVCFCCRSVIWMSLCTLSFPSLSSWWGLCNRSAVWNSFTCFLQSFYFFIVRKTDYGWSLRQKGFKVWNSWGRVVIHPWCKSNTVYKMAAISKSGKKITKLFKR